MACNIEFPVLTCAKKVRGIVNMETSFESSTALRRASGERARHLLPSASIAKEQDKSADDLETASHLLCIDSRKGTLYERQRVYKA